MTFSPMLPMAGYAGWSFLKRTMDQQTKAFEAQAVVKRDESYFREKIGSIQTAEQLVNDPRLLRVALGAFGLESDMGSKFFLRKVLEEGTLSTTALASKLTDKRYQKFSAAFGFGDFSTPRTKLSYFSDELLSAYKTKQFAIAVGSQSEEMRLALNAEQELPDLATSSASKLSKWFTVLGNEPLRKVFETAFGLPTAFGAIDIDKQAETLMKRSLAAFGSDDIAQFSEPAAVEKLIKQYLVRSEISATNQLLSGGQIALTLLQQSNRVYLSRF